MAERYICSNCGTDLSFTDTICPKCGEDVSEIEDSEPDSKANKQRENVIKSEKSKPTETKRYPALRTIAGAYYGMAFAFAALAILLIILVLNTLSETTKLPTVLALLIIGIIGFVSLIAYAESISVFLDIEENTRATAQLLSKLLEQQNRD